MIDWDGAPRRSLTDALAASWQILGRMKQASAGGGGRTAGLRGMCLACLDGYERDAAWLKEIGVRYFVFEDLSWGRLAVQRLDQLEAMWRAEVADPECIQDPAFFSRYQMTVEQARADKRRSRR